jgi:hypothetical protein
MTTTLTSPATADTRGRPGSRLLWGLAVAGPLFMGSSLTQAALRPGFDIRKHAASLLTDGDLGWVQTTTFVLAGLATIVGAAGLARSTPGSRWAPALLACYGLSLVGAGLFTADPAQGFPIGAPEGPGAISGHGIAHLMIGSAGFLTLIAATAVLARQQWRSRRRGWAVWSAATGVVFTASFAGIASGSASTTPAITLSFWTAVGLAWVWLTALAVARLRGTG